MLNLLKYTFGPSIAGGLKKHSHRYKGGSNVFDSTRINCRVVQWSYPKRKYQFIASCYCDDAFAVPAASNWLTIFESKSFETRQEAEAALDLDIVYASKKFKGSAFYRERYYPEHDATGEGLCCKNAQWFLEDNLTVCICPGCHARYSYFPESKICNNCGEIIT